jgi:hypothetical protein
MHDEKVSFVVAELGSVQRTGRSSSEGAKATLMPSIGNWQLPCQSHYWIRGVEHHARAEFLDSLRKWVQQAWEGQRPS